MPILVAVLFFGACLKQTKPFKHFFPISVRNAFLSFFCQAMSHLCHSHQSLHFFVPCLLPTVSIKKYYLKKERRENFCYIYFFFHNFRTLQKNEPLFKARMTFDIVVVLVVGVVRNWKLQYYFLVYRIKQISLFPIFDWGSFRLLHFSLPRLLCIMKREGWKINGILLSLSNKLFFCRFNALNKIFLLRFNPLENCWLARSSLLLHIIIISIFKNCFQCLK